MVFLTFTILSSEQKNNEEKKLKKTLINLNKEFIDLKRRVDLYVLKEHRIAFKDTNSIGSEKIATHKNEFQNTPSVKNYNQKYRNSLIYYYGFMYPSDSNFRNYQIQFRRGHHISIQYNRQYRSLFVGTSLSAKFYDNYRVMGIPILNEMNVKGNNQLISTSVFGGWEIPISDLFFFRVKVSNGIAFTDHKLKIQNEYLTQSDTSFYYSLLIGAGVQWTHPFEVLIFYQYDGNTNTQDYSKQSFNQVGISFGLDY